MKDYIKMAVWVRPWSGPGTLHLVDSFDGEDAEDRRKMESVYEYQTAWLDDVPPPVTLYFTGYLDEKHPDCCPLGFMQTLAEGRYWRPKFGMVRCIRLRPVGLRRLRRVKQGRGPKRVPSRHFRKV